MLDSEKHLMEAKARDFSDGILRTVWEALSESDLEGYYDLGARITMVEWAQVVESEMSRRNLPKQ